MSERVQKAVKLDAIRENPNSLRSVNRQDANYLSLVDSIKNRGVLNPILLRQVPSQDGVELYGLVDGLQRYTASMDAGLKEIPAQIINMDDGAAMEAQIITNVQRVDTKPVEYSKQLQRLLALNPYMTLHELATKLSKTTQWLNERLGLLKLDPNIAALVDEGKVNLSNAYMLAKLPPEEQANFLDRAITMTPQQFTPTVANRKKEIEAARRQGRDVKPAEFQPVPHLQKLSEIKNEMDSPSIGPTLIREKGLKTPEEGFAMAILWVLHMDERSIEVAKEADLARKKKATVEKAAAAVDRAEKKAKEAAQAAAAVSAAAGV